MRWAKTRPRVTCDLAASGLQAVTTAELLGDVAARDTFDLGGPNDEGYEALRAAIGDRYGMPISSVALGNGASGANFLACMALLRPGDDALIEAPAYDPLAAAARAAGARVVPFARRWEQGFSLDPDAVRSALTPNTRLVVLSNAHNPSGSMAPRDAIAQVGLMAEAVGAHVLVDEVYAEAQHVDAPVPLPAARLSDVFVSTSSLTKAYGLAGLRCGWALASPPVAARIRAMRDVVDGTGAFPAEQLAVVAFGRIEMLRARARAILAANLARVRAMASAHPRLDWLMPEAGTTAFPRVRGVDDTSGLVDRLVRDFDTLVVPGRFFDAPAHIRIGFGGRPEMVAEGVARLDRALRAG